MKNEIKDLFKESFVESVPDGVWNGVKERINQKPVFLFPHFKLAVAGVFSVLVVFSAVFGVLKSAPYNYDAGLFDTVSLDDDLLVADFGSDVEAYFL